MPKPRKPAAGRWLRRPAARSLDGPDNVFGRVARWSALNPWQVIVGFIVTAALSLSAAVLKLEINTDPGRMIAADLPFRQAFSDLVGEFPQLDQTFVVAVSNPDPAAGRAVAASLAQTFRSRPDLFADVYSPGTSAFFDDHGLLYLPAEEVRATAARIKAAAPMLQLLASSPDLAGFSQLIAGVSAAAAQGPVPEAFTGLINEAGATAEARLGGKPRRFDWTGLIERPARPAETDWYLSIKPRLDFAALDPAAAAMGEARRIVATVDAARTAVALTGEAAVNAEEFEAVTDGAAIAGIASLVLVTLVMWLGLPAVRLIVPGVILLVIGFLLNAGFATASVGYLNMISVAFAVLFIGLGIDYAVHVILRFWEERQWRIDAPTAAARAAARAGPALLICTGTTALAFLAFVPTGFVGMSQLGIIASGGVVIAFIASLTLVPAVLGLLPLPDRASCAPRAMLSRHPAWYHVRLATTVFTIFVAVAGFILLPLVRFDGDPVNLKDPHSPAVVAFKELLKREPGEAYAAHVLAGSQARARALAVQLAALPEVREVRTVESFLPPQQAEKRSAMASLNGLVPAVVATLPTPPPGIRRAAVDQLTQSLQGLEQSDGASAKLKTAARQLRANLLLLDAAGPAGEDTLAELETDLFSGLPGMVRQLNNWLQMPELTSASLPGEIRDRYIAADGRRRLEVLPEGDMRQARELDRFVAAITAVAPAATGAPVEIAGAAAVVADAMRTATLVAFGLLLAVLIVLLRRVSDILLVLAPLLLAALLLLAYTVIFHSPFNFANVIVLPLLLGIGVDANVHYVLRAREELGSGEVADTSTPRAVLISALTTIGSFGTLWLSPHKGMSSMGELLTVAIAITLVCTLVVLPQLIAWTIARRRPGA